MDAKAKSKSKAAKPTAKPPTITMAMVDELCSALTHQIWSQKRYEVSHQDAELMLESLAKEIEAEDAFMKEHGYNPHWSKKTGKRGRPKKQESSAQKQE